MSATQAIRGKHLNYSYDFKTNFRSRINYEPELRNISSEMEVILDATQRKWPFLLTITCYKYEPLIIDRYFVSFLEQDHDLKNVCSYISIHCYR